MATSRLSHPAGFAVAVCIAVMGVGQLGCSDDGDGKDDSATNDANAGAVDGVGSCPKLRQREGGECCPPGTVFVFATDSCVEVGPPACKATVSSEPDACVPRWCFDWQTEAGKACTPGAVDCRVEPRTCTAAELTGGKGCPAGRWPAPHADGKCVEAGTGPGLSAKKGTEKTPKYGLAALPGVPPITPPRWCWDGGPAMLCTAGSTNCGVKPRECTRAEREADKGCPAGSAPRRDKDGSVVCKPAGVDWICPPGFIATAAPGPGQLQGCKPDPARCPKWWGPASAPAVIHVDADAGSSGDGSSGNPFATLQAAWKKAAPGATILLAPGTYTAPVIDRAVTIRGVCAAKVTLHQPQPSPGVYINAKGGSTVVELHDLAITSKGTGLVVVGGLTARGSGLFIHDVGLVGATAIGTGSKLELVDSVVAGINDIAGKTRAGVLVAFSAGLNLRRCRISRALRVGVEVQEKAVVVADEVLIDSVKPSGGIGLGALLTKGARLTARSTRIYDAPTAAMSIENKGTRAHLQGVLVDRLAGAPSVSHGHGISTASGANVEVAGVWVRSSFGAGLLVQNIGSVLIGGGLRVSDVAVQPKDGKFGTGLEFTTGTTGTLAGVWIERASKHGVSVSGTTTPVRLVDVVVADTFGQADGEYGWGIAARTAKLVIERARIHNSLHQGLYVANPAAHVVVTDTLITGTRAIKRLDFVSAAIGMTHEAQLFLQGVRLSDNACGGISSLVGARLHATGLLVDRIRPVKRRVQKPVPKEFIAGFNVLAHSRSELRVAGSRFSGGTGIATSITGARLKESAPADHRSRLWLSGSVLDRAVPHANSGQGGIGLFVDKRGDAAVHDSLLVGHHTAAATVNLGGELTIGRSVLRRTQPSKFGLVDDEILPFADGINVVGGSTAVLTDSLVHGHARAGLLADGTYGGAKNKLTVEGTLVTGCGFGLAVQNDAISDHKAAVIATNKFANINTKGALPVPEAPAPIPIQQR